MNHQVVAGRAEHRDGAAGDARAPRRSGACTGATGRCVPALRARWRRRTPRAGDSAAIGAGDGADDRGRHASSPGHVREHTLIGLGVGDPLPSRVAHGLRTRAGGRDPSSSRPGGAAPPSIPSPARFRSHTGRDVEQDLRLEVALFRLMRLEHEHRRRAERGTGQRIALGLRVDPRSAGRSDSRPDDPDCRDRCTGASGQTPDAPRGIPAPATPATSSVARNG